MPDSSFSYKPTTVALLERVSGLNSLKANALRRFIEAEVIETILRNDVQRLQTARQRAGGFLMLTLIWFVISFWSALNSKDSATFFLLFIALITLISCIVSVTLFTCKHFELRNAKNALRSAKLADTQRDIATIIDYL